MKKLLAMLLALMLAVSVFTVAVFADTTTQNTDSDDEGDTATVDDTEEPAKEENPKTGLALAALPIVVSAAAAVVTKKH